MTIPAIPGSVNLSTLAGNEIIQTQSSGARDAQTTVDIIASYIFGRSAPQPLSIFFSSSRTTPEEAMAFGLAQGVTCFGLDQAYTWTGSVNVDIPRFQIWGYGKVQTKEFAGSLFILGSSSRWTAVRDFWLTANGDTHSGHIFEDHGGGNGFYENCYCLDVADGYHFYVEADAQAFNRGVFVGGYLESDNPDNAAIKMYEDADVTSVITGNGDIVATRSGGILLDAGAAQELKCWGVTSNMPIANKSVKLHLTDCRLTKTDGSPSLITIDPTASSNLLTISNSAFATPVLWKAKKGRIVGCTFDDITIDAQLMFFDPVDITGTLVYSGGWSGAALRPVGVTRLSNAAAPEINALDGDVFNMTAVQNPTFAPPINPSPGQVFRLRFTASGADRTIAFSSAAGGFSTAGFSITATTQDETDTWTFMYDLTSNLWYALGMVKGDAAPPDTLGPDYVNSGSLYSVTGDGSVGASVTVPLPSPITVGNLLIISVTSKNNISHTYPVGWTKVDQDNAGALFTQSWGWRVADGSEVDPAITVASSTAVMAGIIVQYSGANAVPIGNVSQGTGTGVTTRVVGSVNTTADNSTVVYMLAASGGAGGTDDAPGGAWTERGDTSSAPSAHFTFGDQFIETSGSASGGISLTGSASANYVGRQIELKAA